MLGRGRGRIKVLPVPDKKVPGACIIAVYSYCSPWDFVSIGIDIMGYPKNPPESITSKGYACPTLAEVIEVGIPQPSHYSMEAAIIARPI